MDPLKPKEIQPNQEQETEETLENFEGIESEQITEYIEQKPSKSETGFAADKAKTAQNPTTQTAVVQNNDTNTPITSKQDPINDNPTNVDALVEEVVKLDASTTKPGKKARDELFRKASKAQN